MAYNDTLIVGHIWKTRDTELLSEREKHRVGLADTMTSGPQVCTRNRIEKARGSGISDDGLNALVAAAAAVDSGATAATARVGFGQIAQEEAPDRGDVCTLKPEGGKTEE